MINKINEIDIFIKFLKKFSPNIKKEVDTSIAAIDPIAPPINGFNLEISKPKLKTSLFIALMWNVWSGFSVEYDSLKEIKSK